MRSATANTGTSDFATPRMLTVETRGLSWLDISFQILIVCAFPVAVLFVIYLSGPRPPANVLPELVEIVVFLIILDFALEEMSSVRRITLDAQGVQFRFIIHTEVRKWEDLEPGKSPPEHHGWWLVSRLRNGKPARQRGYRITIDQARAILGYPSCPEWELSPTVLRRLGLALPATGTNSTVSLD